MRMTHLLITQIQELVELDSTVGECTERPLLLELGCEGGIGDLSLTTSNRQYFCPFSAMFLPSIPHTSQDQNFVLLTILRCRVGTSFWRPSATV